MYSSRDKYILPPFFIEQSSIDLDALKVVKYTKLWVGKEVKIRPNRN